MLYGKTKEFVINYSIQDPSGNIEKKSSSFILKYPSFSDENKIYSMASSLIFSGSDRDFSIIISTLKVLLIYSSDNINLDECQETYLHVLYDLYARYLEWKHSTLKFKNIKDLKNSIKQFNLKDTLLKYLSSKYSLPITDKRLLQYTDEEAYLELASDIDKKEGDLGLERLLNEEKENAGIEYDLEELDVLSLEDWDRLKQNNKIEEK